jgi:hypothetical protein
MKLRVFAVLLTLAEGGVLGVRFGVISLSSPACGESHDKMWAPELNPRLPSTGDSLLSGLRREDWKMSVYTSAR